MELCNPELRVKTVPEANTLYYLSTLDQLHSLMCSAAEAVPAEHVQPQNKQNVYFQFTSLSKLYRLFLVRTTPIAKRQSSSNLGLQ